MHQRSNRSENSIKKNAGTRMSPTRMEDYKFSATKANVPTQGTNNPDFRVREFRNEQ